MALNVPRYCLGTTVVLFAFVATTSGASLSAEAAPPAPGPPAPPGWTHFPGHCMGDPRCKGSHCNCAGGHLGGCPGPDGGECHGITAPLNLSVHPSPALSLSLSLSLSLLTARISCALDRVCTVLTAAKGSHSPEQVHSRTPWLTAKRRRVASLFH
eukprot:COSAG02_NODE_3115_length_7335_cov_2.741017_9_plen_156_part_00